MEDSSYEELAPRLLEADAVPSSQRPGRSRGPQTGPAPHGEITIGFVPMIDCAVLVAAHALGCFERHGLAVKLAREVGWATIRDKLLLGELQAAHAPATLAFVLQAGLGVTPRPCLTGFVLNLNGSAITLSRELWEKGVRDAQTLRAFLEGERHRRLSFGAPLEYSTQHFDLRRWLRTGGIDADGEVQMTYVPSPIIHHQLASGHLDGYCVGEPWGSLAVEAGTGWIAATTAELAPGQIEKVLLVLREFAEDQPAAHLAMISALIEASAFCEAPENRRALARLLAQPEYLNLPEELIARSLVGPLPTGHGERAVDEFISYQRRSANVPDRVRARQLLEQIRTVGSAGASRTLRPELIPGLFREDLYRAAYRQVHPGGQIPTAGIIRTATDLRFTDSPLRTAVSGQALRTRDPGSFTQPTLNNLTA